MPPDGKIGRVGYIVRILSSVLSSNPAKVQFWSFFEIWCIKSIVADEHGFDGNYINIIIDLTDSEYVLDSHSHNVLCAQWIDYIQYNNEKL